MEVLTQLKEEITQLTRMNSALREEMREVRRENTLLRQQLDEARGCQTHQPYSAPPPPKRLSSEAGRPVTPVKERDQGDVTMADGSPRGGVSPDPKRIRAPEVSASSNVL